MVSLFEVRADLCKCKPGWFELAARVERRLIRVVLTLWISTRAKCVDRQGSDTWPKLNYADIRSTGDAVAPFLSALGRRVKREDRAVVTIHTTNSEARLGIVKILVAALIDTLQAIQVAPRNSPRAEI